MELSSPISSSHSYRINMPMENSSIKKRLEEQDKSLAEKSKLSETEQQTVRQMKEIDRAVRAHEQAHMNAGGGIVSGSPSFVYQLGPDGKQYAVGGEVHINSGEVSGDPETTLRKMEKVRRAALAPAKPSDQDQRVAAQAAVKAAKARMEIQKQKQVENGEKVEQPTPAEQGNKIKPQTASEKGDLFEPRAPDHRGTMIEQPAPAESRMLIKTAAESYSSAASPFGSGSLLNLTA